MQLLLEITFQFSTYANIIDHHDMLAINHCVVVCMDITFDIYLASEKSFENHRILQNISN